MTKAILVKMSESMLADFKSKCATEGVGAATQLRRLASKWLTGSYKRADEIQHGGDRRSKERKEKIDGPTEN